MSFLTTTTTFRSSSRVWSRCRYFHSTLAASISRSKINEEQPSRTVFVGNLPSSFTLDALITSMSKRYHGQKFGALELISILPQDSCMFLKFFEEEAATRFFKAASRSKFYLHGKPLWFEIRPTLPANLALIEAVGMRAASRAIRVTPIDFSWTEESIKEAFAAFGFVEHVHIDREGEFAYVSFLDLLTSDAVVRKLQENDNAIAAGIKLRAEPAPDRFGAPPLPVREENREVLISNLDTSVSTRTLCEVMNAGVVESIRRHAMKPSASIRYVFPYAAARILRNREQFQSRLKGAVISAGEYKTPVAWRIRQAVSLGLTRTLFIGQIPPEEISPTPNGPFRWEKNVKEDLGEELGKYVYYTRILSSNPKSCLFLNFTNIYKALEAAVKLRKNESYSRYDILFGAERFVQGSRYHQPRTKKTVEARPAVSPIVSVQQN